MRLRVAFAFVCIAAAAACSGGSTSPSGWQPLPGATGVWTTGTGDAEQRYTLKTRPFDGTLQALASQQVVNVVLEHRGAKFVKSDVFGPCPGAAALATFSLGKGRALDEGFSVQKGQAVLVDYERPTGTATNKDVQDAMQNVLCLNS